MFILQYWILAPLLFEDLHRTRLPLSYRGFSVNVCRFFLDIYSIVCLVVFVNFTMACETHYSNALQGSQGWGGKNTFVKIVCTGFTKLLQWLPVIAFAVNTCPLSYKPFTAIAISDWFRKFYFSQKMRITKMKNALKSRSLFVLYTQNKKRIPVRLAAMKT